MSALCLILFRIRTANWIGVVRISLLSLLTWIFIPLAVRANDAGDFLGRRITKVEVVIEGAPNSNVGEMRSLVDVAPGQDYSPVRIHDSLLRLFKSGLISGARVEGVNDGANGVIVRFLVKPQAR